MSDFSFQLKRPIVPIEEWISDTYYTGNVNVWDYWKEKIIEFYRSGKRSFIFHGSYGLGKSQASRLILLREIYVISCISNLMEFFNLSPTTVPKLFFISVTQGKAKSTGIAPILRMVDTSGYFTEVERRDKNIKSYLAFPFAEVFYGSQIDNLIGEDSFGAVLDEANFVKARKGDEFIIASKLFNEVRNRAKGRFSNKGVFYGLSGILSSASFMTSFAETEIKQGEVEGDTFTVSTALYHVEKGKFSKKKFRVFAGMGEIEPHIMGVPRTNTIYTQHYLGDSVKSFIAKNYGMTYDQFIEANRNRVEEVPIDFLPEFERDIEYGLNSICGLSVNRSSKFIKNPKILFSAYSEELKNPLMVMFPELSVLTDATIEDFIDEGKLLDNYEDGADVFVHVDQSVSASQDGDRSGIAFVYRHSEGHFKLLLAVSVTREVGKEIDISKVLDIVFYLRDLGMNIRYVTYDQYAGRYARQELEKRLGKDEKGKSRQGYQSVDKDDTQYMFLSLCLKKHIFDMYRYEPLEKELLNLVHDKGLGKVDHPEVNDDNGKGSKDVADAVVGALFNCFSFEGLSEEELTPFDKNDREIDRETALLYGVVGDGESDGFYEGIISDTDQMVEGVRERIDIDPVIAEMVRQSRR